VLLLCVAGPARADEPLLMQAAKAWDAADLNAAGKLYQEALEQGGLYPSDVLVAYSRLGTVQAAMNQANAALSSFRVAAALDPSFELPSEAGPKAKQIYKKARAEAQKQIGKLEVTAEIPTSSRPGEAFSVTANVPEAFVPLIDAVGITVRDPSVPSMKPYTSKKPAATSTSFDVPGKVVISGASLLVRVDALDQYGNRWASNESRVKVDQREQASLATKDPMPDDDEDREKDKKKKSKGFWASPWPWVIGGALVVGGVTTYFLARPTDEVNVSAPQWR
jgi:tetratricopeptide (TPR) repeat protein